MRNSERYHFESSEQAPSDFRNFGSRPRNSGPPQNTKRAIKVMRALLVRRRCKFPFRKRSMPFSQYLEIFLTVNDFFSTKLKKKENL